MTKILVVDDDAVLSSTLRYSLVKAGYEVEVASDGEAALGAARRIHPDLVVLDIMLPKLDGFEVCRILRQESGIPIIMLTARDDETDLILGLEIGADDYMPKPFSLRELLVRIKALLRRAEIRSASRDDGDEKPLRAGALQVDLKRHQASVGGAPLHLKPKEFDLLAFMMRHRGRAFSRDQLLEQVWGYDFDGGARTVDVHVRWLREKVEENPSDPESIETVRGLGYRFRE